MRPSKIKQIKAKVSKWLCPPGFAGITICGTVYVRSEKALKKVMKTDGIDSTFENHELIHVRQAESTGDSWLRFYLLYAWYWLKNLPMLLIWIKAPYVFIPFELEAYGNQYDMEYTNGRCDEWRKYKKLSFKTRWKLVKLYADYRKNNPIAYTQFIEWHIKPLI